MIKPGWLPPVSPHGLIQEQIWPDEWMLLVVCVLLNQTQRKQVERVLPRFVELWPTPQAFLQASVADVVAVIKPLGFSNRRSKNLLDMTRCYLTGSWQHARELPGIGEYGAACHEVFCMGNVPTEPPDDHALKQYVVWYNQLLPARRCDDLVVFQKPSQDIAVDTKDHARNLYDCVRHGD